MGRPARKDPEFPRINIDLICSDNERDNFWEQD